MKFGSNVPCAFVESQPTASHPWSESTNAKPYIDELYITQDLSREEYFFRIYAENLLTTVWESINFAELLQASAAANAEQ